jgi:hypothetical protein
MAPIEPSARRANFDRVTSFEFPCEEFNVSRDLDSKLQSDPWPARGAPPFTSSSTNSAPINEPAIERTFASGRSPAPPPSQSANPETPDWLATGIESHSRTACGCGDPLINELNRFRGLVWLSKSGKPGEKFMRRQ